MMLASLKPESRTLLIPLAGRVHAARVAPESGFADPQAAAMAKALRLDLDALAKHTAVARGSVQRAQIFDRAVAAWGGARVVNLGAGLCTRRTRIDFRGEWIDVDFADVLALRQDLDPATDTHRYVALDADAANACAVLSPLFDGTETLLVAEGVLMFLEEPSVRALFVMLAAKAGAAAIFDYMHPLTRKLGPRVNPSLAVTGGTYRWATKDLASAVAPLRVVRDDLFGSDTIDRVARRVLGGSLFNVAMVST